MNAREARCERHPNSVMVVDCHPCREAIRAAIRTDSRPDCGAKQPHRNAACERAAGHDGEHRATLTPGHTHCFWNYPDGAVGQRPAVGDWRA